MTLGEKITKQRKELNYTQEQLADILSVSRQTISKWESDIAYPETEKLLKLGKIFDCSMDYLLKEECTDKSGKSVVQNDSGWHELKEFVKRQMRERKSEKILCGMPLYHIGRNARGFVAVGLNAKGVLAIGLKAKGVVSIGLFSLGVLSMGLLSVGLIAVGILAVGLLSAGTIALGLFAAGAISLGLISVGALSAGCFSCGALAIGKYMAVGDYARGMLAIGDTEAIGSVYQHIGSLESADISYIIAWMDANVPSCLTWAKDIFRFCLGY